MRTLLFIGCFFGMVAAVWAAAPASFLPERADAPRSVPSPQEKTVVANTPAQPSERERAALEEFKRLPLEQQEKVKRYLREFPESKLEMLLKAIKADTDLDSIERPIPGIVIQMSSLIAAIQECSKELGEIDRGEDIYRILTGANRLNKVYYRPHADWVSADGRFVDVWQTPFAIEIDGDSVNVTSAGPNRIFDGKDDIVRTSKWKQ